MTTNQTEAGQVPAVMEESSRLRASPQLDKLALALARAQGKIKGAAKDRENPHFRTKYADLASVWDACREALTENGLAIVQPTSGGSDGTVTVTTVLVHASGQWIAGDLTLRPRTGDPQGIGSALTYGRRYGLAGMVGVAPEDDDGEGAGENGHRASGFHDAPPMEDEPAVGDDPVLSDKQRKTIWAIAKALSAPTASEPFKAWLTEQVGFHIDSLSTMKATTADLVIEALRAQERALPKGQGEMIPVQRGRP